jgi:D-amino-acid dehydrogenase
MYSPIDEVGDTRMFVLSLAAHLAGHGVTIRTGASANSLQVGSSKSVNVLTDQGAIEADAVVLATGGDSPSLMRSVGLRLPIHPVRGYTVTLPSRNDAVPPVGMVDEEGLVAIARIGDRVRLGGTAEFGRTDRTVDRKGFMRLVEIGKRLFPDGADWERPDPYVCLRPMTPDGPPILGRSSVQNVYLNIGHGHIGWTMAAGAGRIIADLIVGQRPSIPIDAYSAERYARR